MIIFRASPSVLFAVSAPYNCLSFDVLLVIPYTLFSWPLTRLFTSLLLNIGKGESRPSLNPLMANNDADITDVWETFVSLFTFLVLHLSSRRHQRLIMGKYCLLLGQVISFSTPLMMICCADTCTCLRVLDMNWTVGSDPRDHIQYAIGRADMDCIKKYSLA
jgi:hypothetical protein